MRFQIDKYIEILLSRWYEATHDLALQLVLLYNRR
jgi:hypothetical protein